MESRINSEACSPVVTSSVVRITFRIFDEVVDELVKQLQKQRASEVIKCTNWTTKLSDLVGDKEHISTLKTMIRHLGKKKIKALAKIDTIDWVLESLKTKKETCSNCAFFNGCDFEPDESGKCSEYVNKQKDDEYWEKEAQKLIEKERKENKTK